MRRVLVLLVFAAALVLSDAASAWANNVYDLDVFRECRASGLGSDVCRKMAKY